MKLFIKWMLIVIVVITSIPKTHAQSTLHSDYLDVLHYNITLDITDFTNQYIQGNTELIVTPKVNNLQFIELDFMAFFIDSIMIDSTILNTWDHNDTLLTFYLPHSYNISDTFSITITYYGHPQEDPGPNAWGGFKWSGETAFNLGVGFESIPHNFGRCWYPCIDDFVDRATYDFYITVTGALNHMAVCNGTLMSQETNLCTQKRLCHWHLSSEIPTYLASVAVDEYVAVRDTFVGILDSIPIQIWVRPHDTLSAKNSFINLKTILTLFEDKFGPYRWERVGYVGVNFDAGAMEHATNIAIPNFCINGGTAYEELFAHELSHHWFGDLITCHTAQDMWINEGWATFSEMVYEEAFFGRNTMVSNKRDKLKKVLQLNHIEEGGYVTLNQVPDSITYGSSSYDKGGLVTQTLRSYLGDSLFYASVKDLLETFKFTDITSEQMRDYLSLRTGIDMTGFFDNWVFSPGFPHFSVDSFTVVPNGLNYDVTVYTKEKLRGRSNYSVDNEVEVVFMGDQWQQIAKTVNISNGAGVNTFTLPFIPHSAMMDLNERTDDATSDLYKTIKAVGSINFLNTYFMGSVTSVPDSVFMRVEHNWVAPDGFKNPIPGIIISHERYWKIDGILSPGFNMLGKFYYSKVASSTGYLDNQLITNSVDSLVLLYRPGAWADWTIYPSHRTGNSALGYMNTDSVLLGEYTFGIRNWALYQSTGEIYNKSDNQLRIIPNPASESCVVKYDFETEDNISVIDVTGKIVYGVNASQNLNQVNIPISDYKPGLYFIQVNRKDGKSVTGRLVVEQ